jgi:hypothetical protein
MNWLEAFFGLSPDNGDGSFESAIVLALVVAVILVLTGRQSARYWRRR